MDPNNIFGDVSFNNLILWLLSLSTLIFIMDSIGLLPQKIAKWLAQNRLDATIRALQSLGVKITWDGDKASQPSRITQILDSIRGNESEYKIKLKSLLAQHTIEATVDVGERRTFAAQSFIDVIGSTTDPDIAKTYARIIYTHLHAENLLDFDFIATPKDGSPLLGYEFAALSRKPLVLGICSKGNDATGKNRSHLILDYPLHMSLETLNGLLVDDSTTGGRKMIELAEALRAEGATVSRAAVLFEPLGKEGRKALQDKNIELYAIVPGPKGRT